MLLKRSPRYMTVSRRQLPVAGNWQQATGNSLERHLILFFRRGAGRGRGGTPRAIAAAFLAIALPIEHLHLAGDDLGAVALLARLLVFPAVGADGAFDVDQRAFAQVLPADLGQARPGHDVVPLGALLLF